MTQKFLIPEIHMPPSRYSIQGQDARHIAKVLRLTVTDQIQVTNGEGMDFTAQITAVSRDRVELDIIEVHSSSTESSIAITLCSGMLKDKKMDLVIKHVTQLGICRWIPFFCRRSIPTPDRKRMENRSQRWKSIAQESLKQCQRSRVPEIVPPLNFEQVLDHAVDHDLKIAFWEEETQRLNTLKKAPAGNRIMVLVGPEGGFTKTELSLAKEKGFSSFSLGPRILRAETASICACTLIQHLLGDM